MNLLIVEDELRLRQSLTEMMPWEQAGITGVTAVATVEEGKRWMQLKRPDILLVDIQLPDGDGLTLVKHAMEWNPEVKAVVLSGHDHFPYAQEALSMGVRQYLLKPAGEDAILQAVTGAVSERHQEIQRKHDYDMLRQQWHSHLPVLRQRILRQGVDGSLSAKAFSERMAELGIALKGGDRYAVVVIDPDPYPQERVDAFGGDRGLMHFSVGQVVEETMTGMEYGSVLFCREVDRPLIILFQYPPVDATRDQKAEIPNGTAASDRNCEMSNGDIMIGLHALAGKMLEYIKASLKLTVSAGISSICERLADVPRLYKEAEFALSQRLVHGGDIVIPYRNHVLADSGKPSTISMCSERWEREIDIAWNTADGSLAMELADAWISRVCSIPETEMFKEQMMVLQSWIITWLRKQGWSLAEVIGEDVRWFFHTSELRTKQEWSGWMRSVMGRISEEACMVRRRGGNRLVAEVKELIERELHTELTLQDVADRLFINASYLSRLFKLEMNQPFSSYLLTRRMERAKEALFQGDRVYQAAQAAGFRDVSYFTKVFRKYWGVTPSDWKRT
ncbi:response regulator [Paenibacillus sp.]|jgi:two-component system response regulator YesN|uniref:response regulator n=1 Tax=Paenibacillus sp. TaxID=58172 RepID=UPI002828A13C|nr:helix-turn-helix domain-containing protein [Paenibacillus sp.]MDR0267250.1 response regulator [Paenibacillus sp.]